MKLREKEEEVGRIRGLLDRSMREPGTGYVIDKETQSMVIYI